MSRLPGLYQWNDIVAKRFSHLSKPMAACLALWSLGMIVARSCSLTAVAWAWAPILNQKFYSLRERLRDLYREAPAKAGGQRCELDLAACWAPWLAWVIEGWRGQQLALALDATTLGQRFTVLAISVLYRGCAVPVAWKIVKATEKHAWEPEWKTLLSHFRQVVPADWKVIVLTDRGLYAQWLFEAITALGWRPLMRINHHQGKFRPQGWHHWMDLKELVTRPGQRWQGRGTAFKNTAGRLECTLLACWGEGYADPWLVVTDLPPEAAEVCWYGLHTGSSKDSSGSNAAAGNGNTHAWKIPHGRNVFGWPWRSQRGGCCRWAARPTRRFRWKRWPRRRTPNAVASRVGA